MFEKFQTYLNIIDSYAKKSTFNRDVIAAELFRGMLFQTMGEINQTGKKKLKKKVEQLLDRHIEEFSKELPK